MSSRGLAAIAPRLPQTANTCSCRWPFSLSLFPFLFFLFKKKTKKGSCPHLHSVAFRLNNTDRNVYPGPGAILANIKNADCSEVIAATAITVKPATGYTVALADMIDQTKVCHFLFLVSFNGYQPQPRMTGLCRFATVRDQGSRCFLSCDQCHAYCQPDWCQFWLSYR